METRNASVLREVVAVLSSELVDAPKALNQLESHFHDRLIIDVGSVTQVGAYAEQLRLRISEAERATVLDYIGEKQMGVVTIDMVENAINERFGWDRFIEP